MENKQKKHAEQMKELKKRFKKYKLLATLVWLSVLAVIITCLFLFATVEVIIFGIIISVIITTMIYINYLNRLDKIRVAQETQLMEEAPLGKMKF